LDACLGRDDVAVALRNAGQIVYIHDDHFAEGTMDRKWLAQVGKKGWIVLTKDQRIRYREIEISALMSAKVRAFVLTSGNLRGSEMAAVFVKALARIYRTLKKNNFPFIATISRSGVVTIIRS